MKDFIKLITKPLWYHSESGSTLKPYMWRLHHNGLALLSFFTLVFATNNTLISAITITSLFIVYKLFVQGGGIQNKTLDDIKDFIADLSDYSVIWLVVLYPNRLHIMELFIVLIVIYYFTFKWGWSTPS